MKKTNTFHAQLNLTHTQIENLYKIASHYGFRSPNEVLSRAAALLTDDSDLQVEFVARVADSDPEYRATLEALTESETALTKQPEQPEEMPAETRQEIHGKLRNLVEESDPIFSQGWDEEVPVTRAKAAYIPEQTWEEYEAEVLGTTEKQ